MAQPYTVTWKSGAEQIQCGQLIMGSFAGASNDHDLYFTDSIVSTPERGFASGPERSYRFTLADSSYVYVRQTDGHKHGVIVCADSSNQHPFGALAYFKGLRLGAGTYYLNVEQDVDNPSDQFSVQIQCLASRLPGWPYVSVKSFAEPVQGVFFRLSGNLSQAQNSVDAYNVPTRYTPNPEPYVTYLPEPDRVYSFRVPKEGEVSIHNTGQSDHRVLVLDTTGNSWDVLPLTTMNGINVRQGSSTLLLEAGTYYLSVEQGSATVTSPYEYQVSWTCRPGVPRINYNYFWGYNSIGVQLNGQTQILQTSDDRQCPTCIQYADGFAGEALPLHMGKANNSISVMSNPGYVRMYLDLNRDGDFDDSAEWFYTTRRKSIPLEPDQVSSSGWVGPLVENVLTDNFVLSDSVYRSHVGELMRMRILVTDSTIGSPCGHYRYGQAMDVPVVIDEPQIEDSAAIWVRQISDKEVDSLIAVERVGGGVVVFSKHYLGGLSIPGPQVQGNFRGMSEISLTQASGDRVFVRTGQGDHYFPKYCQLISLYKEDGTVGWIYLILASGVDGVSNPVISSSAPDGRGGVYWTSTIWYFGEPYLGNLARIDSQGNVSNVNFMDRNQAIELDGVDVEGLSGYCLSGRFSSYRLPDTRRLGLPVDSLASRFLYLSRRGQKDVFVGRYTSQRRLLWVIQGSGGRGAKPVRVIAAAHGSGYIIGTADTVMMFTSMHGDTLRVGHLGTRVEYILAVSDSGRLLWKREINTALNGKGLLGVGVGNAGDVVFIGNFRDSCRLDAQIMLHSHGGQDGFAFRMTLRGGVVWASQVGGTGTEEITRIRKGSPRHVYVTVSSQTASPIEEVFGKGVDSLALENRASLFRVSDSTGKAISWEGSISRNPKAMLTSSGSGETYAGLNCSGSSYLEGKGQFYSTVLGTESGAMDILVARLRSSALLQEDYQFVSVRDRRTPSALLSVFPNPATGELTVRMPNVGGSMIVLSVQDLLGRIAYQRTVSGAELNEGVRITSLKPGLYLFRCGNAISRVVVH